MTKTVPTESRHKLEDNIRTDLKDIGVNMKNWIELALDEEN